MPILLSVAGLSLILGRDHPAGKWEERHKVLANSLHLGSDGHVPLDDDKNDSEKQKNTGLNFSVDTVTSSHDTVVQGSPTLVTYFKILASPLTWLPPLAYMTTFGLELAIDGNIANVLFALFNKKRPGFGQTQAGYYTSIL